MYAHLLVYFALQPILKVSANTEKTIFLAPQPLLASSDLANLCLPSVNQAQSTLYTQLALAAISEEQQIKRSGQSWYTLHGFNAGQRYEVRVCWAATVST
jgi:hypothetical protein